jgi:hypothetical protein
MTLSERTKLKFDRAAVIDSRRIGRHPADNGRVSVTEWTSSTALAGWTVV